jgi:hypothetical protein
VQLSTTPPSDSTPQMLPAVRCQTTMCSLAKGTTDCGADDFPRPWPPIRNRRRLLADRQSHHDCPAAVTDFFSGMLDERDRAQFHNLFIDSAEAAPANRSGPGERAVWWLPDSHAAFAPVPTDRRARPSRPAYDSSDEQTQFPVPIR